MEIILLLIAGVLIVTPFMALAALLRTGRLRERLDFAESEITVLRERLSLVQAPLRPPAKSESGKPAAPAGAAPAAAESAQATVAGAPPPPAEKPVIPPLLAAAAVTEKAPPGLPPLPRPPPVPALPPVPFRLEPAPKFVPVTRETAPPPAAAPVPPPIFRTAESKAAPSAAPAKEVSESRVGAWWATRIGITFLIAAVVSFGVYISQQSPLMRVLVVLTLAGAITGLGWWAERKAAIFGQVMFAGGLAMMYFTAYAAYAVETMQVIFNVQLGLLVQFAAVGLVTAVALWRDRVIIATMAIFLGECSCLFALNQDQYAWTLGAALGLLAVGALLRGGRGWAWPLVCGYAGAQLCYAAAVLALLGRPLDPAAGLDAAFRPSAGGLDASIALWYPLAFFLTLVAGDWWAQARGRTAPRAAREWGARIAALCYGAGAWWGGHVLGGEHAGAFNLLIAASACLLAGVLYWRRGELEGIGELFLTAAGAWLAMHFVIEYSGAARWAALLAEAYVFAAWLARRKSPFAWLGLLLAWMLSGLMALWSAIAHGPHGWDGLGAASAFVLWPLAAAGLWAWLERPARPWGDDERAVRELGGTVTAVAALAIGFAAWGQELQHGLFLTVAAAAAVGGFGLRSAAFFRLAGLALAASWVGLLMERSPLWYHWMIPLSEAWLLAVFVRRRAAWSPWLLLTGAWTVSGLVALKAALQVETVVEAWAGARLLFALWPVATVALWTWLERTPRAWQPEEKHVPSLGLLLSALGGLVLCGLAWTGDARAWQFYLLALVLAGLVGVLRGRTGWAAPVVVLLTAILLFHNYADTPMDAGASPAAVVLGLLAAPVLFTLTTLAALFVAQRRAANAQETEVTDALEWVFSLALLRLWAVVLLDQVFALPAAPVGLAFAALALTALAARGPWRALADTAWFWNAAALYLWVETQTAESPLKLTAWVCLAATVALAWWWGVLARRAKPAVRLLRLEIAGQFLPSLLLIGWTWAVQALGNTDAGQAVDAILAAIAYALVARRDWLPSAAVSAVVIAGRAWFLSVGLELEGLSACWVPALVMVGLLFIGWIAQRRVPKAFPETVPMLPGALLLLAFAALAAFIVPVWGIAPADAQKYVTLLWGVAGGVCFAAGLAARLKPYRYAGLAGLAWCLPRLFLVDITDTLGRILAFGALAVVLLAIGFSYERLRAWIDGGDAAEPPAPTPAPPPAAESAAPAVAEEK